MSFGGLLVSLFREGQHFFRSWLDSIGRLKAHCGSKALVLLVFFEIVSDNIFLDNWPYGIRALEILRELYLPRNPAPYGHIALILQS